MLSSLLSTRVNTDFSLDVTLLYSDDVCSDCAAVRQQIDILQFVAGLLLIMMSAGLCSLIHTLHPFELLPRMFIARGQV